MDQVKFDILINATPAQKALNKFANTVTKVVTKVDRQLSGLDKHLGSVSKSLTALNGKSLKGFNKGITTANKNLSSLEQKMRKITSMSGGGRGSSKGVGNRFVSGGMGLIGGYATYGLMGMLGGAVDSGNKFESKMADIKGILANAEGGFGSLDTKIREVGRTSAFTITQMGEAARFMAMAGMKGGDIGNSLGSVANLGMVGGLDVGRSADIMTNIMASMGINSKQSGAVTDVLTATFTNTNTSIEELGQSFAYVGNIAAQTGTSINETAAAIGILGDSGIKGSRAGTNLRQMFLKLAAPTKKGKETIESLGLSLYRIGKDGHRALKPISQILDQFKGTNAGLEEFQDIFGVRGGAAFGALINGAEKFKGVLEKISGSGGLTDQLAEKKMATTAGKTLVMKSVWEDLSITLMEKVRPAYNYVIDGITKLLTKLQTNESFLEAVEGAANSVAIGLRMAYEVTKFLFKLIVDNGESIVKILAGLTAGMVAYGVASAIASLSNPFTMAIAGAAALLILTDKISGKMNDPLRLFKQSRMEELKQKNIDLANRGESMPYKKYRQEKFYLENEMDGIMQSDEEEMINRYWASKNLSAFRYDELTKEQKDSLPKNRPSTQGFIDKAMKAGRDLVAPKGGDADNLLKKLEEIQSSTYVNLGNDGKQTKEGDGMDTLSKATPLTSSRNEMSRSVVVNMNSLVENVNIGGALGSNETASQIQEEIADVFTKVVRDWELGMSK